MKMNKPIAGYHMLMILADVDGVFDSNEGLVIIKYLQENFPFHVNLDRQAEILSNLKKEDYIMHFNNAMNDFYQDSTQKERTHFLDFAVKLAAADKKVTKEENIYLNELFGSWDIETTE
jgi:hypothetical protein